MTYFIGKHVSEFQMRIVTKVPRAGGLEVGSEGIMDDFAGNFPAFRFRFARKWSSREAAERALEIIHSAGFEEYSLMERDDI